MREGMNHALMHASYFGSPGMAFNEHLFHRLEWTIVMEQFDQCPRTLADCGENIVGLRQRSHLVSQVLLLRGLIQIQLSHYAQFFKEKK